jgi:2-oxoisovalerate dehydrogenase E2 component (dihydrolipoyl transacylase)
MNATESEQHAGKVLSTPAVRAFARENDVDINLVWGTGLHGRVTKQDVIDYINGGKDLPILMSSSVQQGATLGIPVGPPLTGITAKDEVKKITGIKKAMTKSMTQGLSIPTFTFSDDIDASATMNLRRELKQQIPDLTLLPFFIKALSLAMNQYPIMNSLVNPAVDEEGYIQEYVIKNDHNFAIAIDSDHGLVTPNIKKI